jgi:outer membrane receptor for ferrienterochelin and colicin
MRLLKIILITCWCLQLSINLFAQQGNTFKQVDENSGQKVPKSLLTIISIELEEVPFEEALSIISEKSNIKLNYNESRLPIDKKISLKMENVKAVKVLLQVLKMTETELIISNGGQLAIVPSKYQQRIGKVKGQVLDKETKAALIGANVIIVGTSLGAATNEHGWFLIENVPVGSYTVQFSYLGYTPVSKTDVIVKSDRITFVNAELTETALDMNEVIVTGGYFSRVEDQPVSATNLSAEEIRRASGTLGDVSRAVVGLPSIAKVNDSFNYLIVRGGSPSENTFFIDNIEMPNISHFAIQGMSGGFLSLFNGDLVSDINFFSGGFSAIYGDKLSSVMDISFREGNRSEIDMQLDMNFAGVGSIAEGPLSGGRGSWLFAARKSFVEMLFKIMGLEGNVPAYTDLQGKLVYDLSAKHQLSLLNIYGISDLSSTRDDAFNDGENEFGGVTLTQNTAGINWRYLWGKHGYSNTSVSHTLWNYDWNWFLTRDKSELFDNNSIEQEFKLRNVNTYRMSPGHKLEFGIEAKLLRTDYEYYNAPYNDLLGNVTPEFRMDQNASSQKFSVFVNHSWRPVQRLILTPGLRVDHFAYNKSTHLSPRFSFSYQLSEKTALNGATGIFFQNLPLILLYQQDAFKNLDDPVSYHFILGISHLLSENTRLTLEAYDKEYNHFPLDPTSPSLFIMDEPIYEIIRFTPHAQLVDNGKAYSRGVEVMLQKKLKKHLYGIISATYFRARYRDYEGVWRNRIYDNRYIFNVEGGYKPNSRWQFSLRWAYGGGWPYTPFDVEASRNLGRGVFDNNQVNAMRLPAYNSLNLRFDRRFYFSGSNLIFYFSVWNVLDRKNIWHYQWNEVANRQEGVLQFERSPVFGLEFEF